MSKSPLFLIITMQGFIHDVLFTYRTLHRALPTQHFAQYTLTVITILLTAVDIYLCTPSEKLIYRYGSSGHQ